MSAAHAPALVIAIDQPSAPETRPWQSRQARLQNARACSQMALERAVSRAGLVGAAATNPQSHTEIQAALDALDKASYQCEHYLSSQLDRLQRQLERALASDAFGDPEDRKAVLVAVNRQRRQAGTDAIADGLLFTATERELLERYRQLPAADRSIVRDLMRRLSSSGAAPVAAKADEPLSVGASV